MKYQVLSAESVDELARQVHTMINNNGWKCQGGVAVSRNPQTGQWMFFQAMVQ